jgi:glycosyltransferase involved in cell wall biosynthesis
MSVSVSVVTPCYNAAPYIADTIRAVLAQTVPIAEHIIVDDGSKDGAAEVVERVAADAGGRVRLLRQENAGVSVARNRGIRASTGDVVAMLDADDLFHPEKIARQLAYLEAHPEIGAVSCGLQVFDGDRVINDASGDEAEVRRFTALDFLGAPRIPQVCSTILMRRAVADAISFPEDIRDGEDIIFGAWLRHVTSIGLVPDILLSYRLHPTQYTKLPRVFSKGVQARLAWGREHYDRVGAQSPEEARQAVLAGAVEMLMIRYWKRELELFDALREELLSVWPADVPTPPELHKKRLPAPLLRLKDRLDGWRRDALPASGARQRG